MAKIFSSLLLFLIVFLLQLFVMASNAFATVEPVYVGTKTCGECHPDQFDTFTKNSKKANSYTSIQQMTSKLRPDEIKECYGCHTTGYGKRGGFRSEQETPHLKDAGCEVCHGPGSLHVESQDPDDLNSVIDVEECMTCHNPERVAAFNFRPVLYGGAH